MSSSSPSTEGWLLLTREVEHRLAEAYYRATLYGIDPARTQANLGGICKTEAMPRHVYRVSIELIYSDPSETTPEEVSNLAELRKRILATPGLVHYPPNPTVEQTWGRARRTEATLIELDIDRDGEEHNTDVHCLLHMVAFLTGHIPLMTVVGDDEDKEQPAPEPSDHAQAYRALRMAEDADEPITVRAWRWDGSVTYRQIQSDIRRINPLTSVREFRDRLARDINAVELLIDVPGGGGSLIALRCKPGDYIVNTSPGRVEVYPPSVFSETFAPVSDPDQLRTPEEWSTLKSVTVLDPDGWMDPTLGPKDWAQPITEIEFDNRVALSTVVVPWP